jgi:serine protease inhibitor
MKLNMKFSLFLLAFSTKMAWSMEIEKDFSVKLIRCVAQKTEERLANKTEEHFSPQKNYVFCPLGFPYILALTDSTTDSIVVKEELKKFTNDPNLTDTVIHLNNQLRKIQNRSSLSFKNAVYVVLDQSFKFKEEVMEKFTQLGAQQITVDFKDQITTANTINDLVKKDTNEKISNIIPPNSLDPNSLSLFLHTLYVKALWDVDMVRNKKTIKVVNKSAILFKDNENTEKYVRAFQINNEDLDKYYKETVPLHFLRDTEKNVDLIAIPTTGDGYVIIRHSKNSHDLSPITQTNIENLLKEPKKNFNELTVPCLSMKKSHDFKELHENDLPKTFKGSFYDSNKKLVAISKCFQEVTFDMTDKGIEGSSVTVEMLEEKGMTPGEVFAINSPFTFTFIIKLDDKNYCPFFNGTVVNHDDMR